MECPKRGGGAQFGSVLHVTAPQVEQKLQSLTWQHAGFQAKLLALFILFISILPFYKKKMCDNEMQYMFISQKVYSVQSQSVIFYWIILEYFLLLQKIHIVFQSALGKIEKINHPSSYEYV